MADDWHAVISHPEFGRRELSPAVSRYGHEVEGLGLSVCLVAGDVAAAASDDGEA